VKTHNSGVQVKFEGKIHVKPWESDGDPIDDTMNSRSDHAMERRAFQVS